MKKNILLILVLIFVSLLCSCTNNNSNEEIPSKSTDTEIESVIQTKEKILSEAKEIGLLDLGKEIEGNKIKAENYVGTAIIIPGGDDCWVDSIELDHCILGGKSDGSTFYIRAFLSKDELSKLEVNAKVCVAGIVSDYGESEFQFMGTSEIQTYIDINPAYIINE